MTNTQKIEFAEKRINELQLLIRHWKANNASSKHVALELIQGLVSEDYEAKSAWSEIEKIITYFLIDALIIQNIVNANDFF